ncbi:hypothetical protein [Zavarzinia sp.]|uniref:hypothetical protein n=1 Tax=Zavarzinia sp. TaxID=2027920 RepID=UPI0035696F71
MSARHDFYGPIHKALRFGSTGLLLRLGNCDAGDEAARAALCADLRAQLALGRAHLDHEERHLHGALEARAPGVARVLEDQHGHHLLRFDQLGELIAALETAPAAGQAAAAQALYLAFSAFIAEDFAHMHVEETVTQPLLHAHFSDDEIRAIEGGIIASLTPEENIAYMRLMLPAMTPAERLGMLTGMRAAAPAEAFTAVIEMAARPCLPARDFADLAAGLALAA